MKFDKYFNSEEGLLELLEDCQDMFVSIDDISQRLLKGMVSTISEYKEILNQATGVYGSLEPLYALAVANKENRELKYYVDRKRELEGTGEKVVVANLDKEANLSVAQERRIRAVLEGYVSSSEKIIITAQTQLKYLVEDYRHKPQEESK